MKTLYLISTLCLIFLLVSCTTKPEESIIAAEEAIIGKWDGGENMTAEFFEDGTMAFKGGGKNYFGRYEFLGENKLKIDAEVDGVTTSVVFKISLSTNWLNITNPDGETGVYEKVQQTKTAGSK